LISGPEQACRQTDLIVMKYSKDLSWLSAPAFFLILGMLALNLKKDKNNRQPEKSKPEITVVSAQKPA
jgi:hypothetical protein